MASLSHTEILNAEREKILLNPNNKVEKFIEKKRNLKKKTDDNDNRKELKQKTGIEKNATKNLPIHTDTYTHTKETRSHKGDYPLFHLTAAR